MSTTLAPAEGLVNWEREIPLTNSLGQCAADFLADDILLRIIVVDANQSKTVFQDFAPAGQ